MHRRTMPAIASIAFLILAGCVSNSALRDEFLVPIYDQVVPQDGVRVISPREPLSFGAFLQPRLGDAVLPGVGAFVTAGTTQLEAHHSPCDAFLNDTVIPSDEGQSDDVGDLQESEDDTAQALSAFMSGDENVQQYFSDSRWPYVGVYSNAFQMRAGVDAPIVRINAGAQQNGISFQAWHNTRSETISIADTDDFLTCCRLEGCGEFLVTGFTDFDQYLYEFSEFSFTANGNYQVVEAEVSVENASERLSKASYRAYRLERMPQPAESLQEVIALDGVITVVRNGETSFTIPSPIELSSIRGESLDVACTYAEDLDRHDCTVTSNGERAGTLGYVVIQHNSLREVRLPIVVQARADDVSESFRLDFVPTTPYLEEISLGSIQIEAVPIINVDTE